jgi:hypothetical protein
MTRHQYHFPTVMGAQTPSLPRGLLPVTEHSMESDIDATTHDIVCATQTPRHPAHTAPAALSREKTWPSAVLEF